MSNEKEKSVTDRLVERICGWAERNWCIGGIAKYKVDDLRARIDAELKGIVGKDDQGVPVAEPPGGPASRRDRLCAVSPGKAPEDAASIPHAEGPVLTDKEIHDITYKQYPVNCVIDDDRPEHPFDLNYDKRRALADKLRADRTFAEWQIKQYERGIQEGDTVLVGKPIDAPEDAAAIPHAGDAEYCLACWNCMPIGETCAVCGRINKG